MLIMRQLHSGGRLAHMPQVNRPFVADPAAEKATLARPQRKLHRLVPDPALLDTSCLSELKRAAVRAPLQVSYGLTDITEPDP